MGTNKSSTSGQTSQTSTYTPAALQQIQNLYGQIQNTSQIPYTPYPNPLVAPLSGTQQAGISNINNTVNSGGAQPYIDAAAQYAIAGANPISPNAIQYYENPFTQQVVDTTLSNINRNNALQQQQLQGNAAAKGALGGDRLGVAQAELARNQDLATNQTLAGLGLQGFNTALSAAQGDAQRQGQAAYTLGNLGAVSQGAQLAGAQAQIGAGAQQQQTQQQQLAAAYGQFLQSQGYPFQTTSYLASLGLPALTAQGGTTQSTGTSSSSGSSGGIGSALGILGSLFGADGGRIPNYDIGGGVPYGGGDNYVSGVSPFYQSWKQSPWASVSDYSKGWVPTMGAPQSNTQPPSLSSMNSSGGQSQGSSGGGGGKGLSLKKLFGGSGQSNATDQWGNPTGGDNAGTNSLDYQGINWDSVSPDTSSWGGEANGGRQFANGGSPFNVDSLIATAHKIKHGLRKMPSHGFAEGGGVQNLGPEFNEGFGWLPTTDQNTRNEATSLTGNQYTGEKWEPGSLLDKTFNQFGYDVPFFGNGENAARYNYGQHIQNWRYPTTSQQSVPPTSSPPSMQPAASADAPAMAQPDPPSPFAAAIAQKQIQLPDFNQSGEYVGQDQPSHPMETPSSSPFSPTQGGMTEDEKSLFRRASGQELSTAFPGDQKSLIPGYEPGKPVPSLQRQISLGGRDPWCADFMNMTENGGTGRRNAQSYLNYGTKVDAPQEGDIVVFSRGGEGSGLGHVGYYAGPGSKPGTIRVLGGNQGDQVSVAEFSTDRVLGYRQPEDDSGYSRARQYVGQGREALGGQRQQAVSQPQYDSGQSPQLGARQFLQNIYNQPARSGRTGLLARMFESGPTRHEQIQAATNEMHYDEARKQQAQNKFTWYPGSGIDPNTNQNVPGMYRLPTQGGGEPQFFPGQTITGRSQGRSPQTDDALRRTAISQAQRDADSLPNLRLNATERDAFVRKRAEEYFQYSRNGQPNATVPPPPSVTPPAPTGTPIVVRTKEERDKLPSGTSYIGPDGKTYIKQ